MVFLQHKSGRKSTGGSYKKQIVRRQHQSGSAPTLTGLGETRKKTAQALGGHTKERMLSANVANVFNPSTNKYSKATISTILENGANRNFARRNIMTKGTLVQTNVGKARITNRPGQEGAINAVLVKE